MMSVDANTNELFSVQDRNVLITGGTAGIGLGIGKHFVEQGANVILSGRREDGHEIATGVGAEFVQIDVSSAESVGDGLAIVAELFGNRIDVLILNAGIDTQAGTIDTLDLEAFRKVYDVNVFGLVQCLRDATPFLHAGASVILTSSPAGCTAAPGMSAYGSSKAAVNHLTRVFAAELASKGIRVNAVLPGIVESEMSGSTGSAEFIRTLTMSGKIRKPNEMGGTFQFLASHASQPITAAIIAADDGISAGISESVLNCIAAQVKV